MIIEFHDPAPGPETYVVEGEYFIESTFLRGDTNDDGVRDLSDAVATLSELFTGAESSTCPRAQDVNDDGLIDISDPIGLLAFLFIVGLAPPIPFLECGKDPTGGELPCDSYAGCA